MATAGEEYKAEVRKAFEEDCKKGNHRLDIVYSSGGDQERHVVRWCRNCGSLVIDVDFDGRTNPGAIMGLVSPAIMQVLK